jgi:hypothetical protein
VGFDVLLEQQNADGSIELLERCPAPERCKTMKKCPTGHLPGIFYNSISLNAYHG